MTLQLNYIDEFDIYFHHTQLLICVKTLHASFTLFDQQKNRHISHCLKKSIFDDKEKTTFESFDHRRSTDCMPGPAMNARGGGVRLTVCSIDFRTRLHES